MVSRLLLLVKEDTLMVELKRHAQIYMAIILDVSSRTISKGGERCYMEMS
jgi:hypothetical protein